MRAAVLKEFGQPQVGSFEDPLATPGCAVVAVTAAAVSHLDLAKASGRFYSGAPKLPCVTGTDGVGRLPDGRRVYFDEPIPPFGSMAERTLVRGDHVVDVPHRLSDVVAAAIGNAGVAALSALETRAHLAPGESVAVLGGTGAVGQLAIQIARLLGAARVVAVGRSADKLERARENGADAVIDLARPGDLTEALRDAAGGGIDVTLDLLWGLPAAAAMRAAAHGARHVQLGHLAGSDICVQAPLLRSKSVTIIGHSGFQVPSEVRMRTYRRVAELAASGRLHIDVDALALSDVAVAWERQETGPPNKIVLVP